MYTYKPSRLAMISIYLFVIMLSLALCAACGFGALFLGEKLKIILIVVMILVIIASFLIMLIVIPLFFSQARYSVSNNEVICRKGVFIFKRQYMKLSSIRSVTAVVTPLSRATGLNFLIINALGSQMVLMFLSRADLNEITKRLDRTIKRGEQSAYEDE